MEEVQEKLAVARQEVTSQLEHAWRVALNEETLARKAMATQVEARIGSIASGIQTLSASLQKASQSEQKLLQHLDDVLQESAEKKLMENFDKALQNEAMARRELHCGLSGRIESLAALVEDAFKAEAVARGDLQCRLEALTGVGNDSIEEAHQDLHTHLEEGTRSAAFVRGELSGRIQTHRTPGAQHVLDTASKVVVSETDDLDPEHSSGQMKALLRESFRGVLDVCEDDSRKLGEGSCLSSRLQQHQSLLSTKLQEHQESVERHIAAVCGDVKRLAGVPTNSSDAQQQPAVAPTWAVPQASQAQLRYQDESLPHQWAPQPQSPQQQQRYQQQQQTVTTIKFVDPVPTPVASRSNSSIEVPCVERTPASSPTGTTATTAAVSMVPARRGAVPTPVLSPTPASAPAVFVTAATPPHQYEATSVMYADAGFKVIPPASQPCLGFSTLTAPASSTCSTPMIWSPGGSAVISRAISHDD